MSKYDRVIKGVTVDVYDVLQAWGVTNPATQHAIKKLLQPGQRGHKTQDEDLAEAIQSIERARQIADAYHAGLYSPGESPYPPVSVPQSLREWKGPTGRKVPARPPKK